MKVAISCRFCNGNGHLDEFTCPCCFGQGTFDEPICPERLSPKGNLRLERPEHPNLFNTTPEYQQRKARRAKTKRQRNTVALTLLGLADFKRSSDELSS